MQTRHLMQKRIFKGQDKKKSKVLGYEVKLLAPAKSHTHIRKIA